MSTPTRIPYGLSFVKPFNSFGATSAQWILEASATPNVSMGTYFQVAASSITITNFLGGERGKPIFIFCNTGGASAIQNSAGGIRFNNVVGTTSAGSTVAFTTAGNITMLNGEVLQFMHNGTDWSLVGDRFVLSTQA